MVFYGYFYKYAIFNIKENGVIFVLDEITCFSPSSCAKTTLIQLLNLHSLRTYFSTSSRGSPVLLFVLPISTLILPSNFLAFLDLFDVNQF